jgi:DinB family protein
MVLQGDCVECGFRAESITPTNAQDTLSAVGARYRKSLAKVESGDAAGTALRTRPNPKTWSPLEYAAHMRDVIALWGWALHRTLTEDQPQLPSPDPDLPDLAASENLYNSQDPSTVARELTENAERMARRVATIVAPDQWQRLAHFGDMRVSALDIVRKVAHEARHHLLDIERAIGGSAD